MDGRNHASISIAEGMAAGALAFTTIRPDAFGLIGGAIVWIATFTGGMYPDIDSEKNTILGDSLSYNKIFFHRFEIHTPMMAILTAVPYLIISLVIAFFRGFDFVSQFAAMTGLSMVAGYITHLFLDSFGPEGIMWLYPFSKKKFRIPIILKKGSIIPKVFEIIFVTGFVYIAAVLFSTGIAAHEFTMDPWLYTR